VEVGKTILSLDLVDSQLDLSEGVILILLQIRQRNLKDSALQRVVCILQTSGAVDKGLPNTTFSLVVIQQDIMRYVPYSRIWKDEGA
jgi:hypothetical protein